MSIRCEGCAHFRPGTINPVAGMGQCGHAKRKVPVYFYPMERHVCRAFEPKEAPVPREAATE